MSRLTLLGVLTTLLAGSGIAFASPYSLPPLPSPERYGDVLIDRGTAGTKEKAVLFNHWNHRNRYSCRVCHFELGFAMQPNVTEITEEDNRQGDFCGACHDGTRAFGHTSEHCNRCHTGPNIDRSEHFRKMQSKLPPMSYGNEINWSMALDQGRIKPLYSLFRADEKPLAFDKEFELRAEMGRIPPAYFSHKTHTPWLDCSSCHPDIFNVKKKGTRHFDMKHILNQQFCGACHLKVAFPADDCQACHPGMSDSPKRY